MAASASDQHNSLGVLRLRGARAHLNLSQAAGPQLPADGQRLGRRRSAGSSVFQSFLPSDTISAAGSVYSSGACRLLQVTVPRAGIVWLRLSLNAVCVKSARRSVIRL
jgi:hypothetical protein